MNTLPLTFVVTLCFTAAFASPLAPMELEDETRTIYSSGGQIYLGFNSTILNLGLLGLGIIILIWFGKQVFAENERSSANSANQQRYDQYEPYQEQVYREKRSFHESKSIHVKYNLSTNM